MSGHRCTGDMSAFECECTGSPDLPGTRTIAELSDATLCIRLGCPEHTVPGGKPIEVAF